MHKVTRNFMNKVIWEIEYVVRNQNCIGVIYIGGTIRELSKSAHVASSLQRPNACDQHQSCQEHQRTRLCNLSVTNQGIRAVVRMYQAKNPTRHQSNDQKLVWINQSLPERRSFTATMQDTRMPRKERKLIMEDCLLHTVDRNSRTNIRELAAATGTSRKLYVAYSTEKLYTLFYFRAQLLQ